MDFGPPWCDLSNAVDAVDILYRRSKAYSNKVRSGPGISDCGIEAKI